jgi:hypothetical protein
MTVYANERPLLGCSVIASKGEIAVPDPAFDLRYLKYAMLAAEHACFRRAASGVSGACGSAQCRTTTKHDLISMISTI